MTELVLGVRVPDHVHWRRFDAEVVLVDLKVGMYYGLNDVAADAFERLAEGLRLGDVVGSLLEVYDVSRGKLVEDVNGFVRSLMDLGLLVADTTTSAL